MSCEKDCEIYEQEQALLAHCRKCGATIPKTENDMCVGCLAGQFGG